MAAAFYEPAGDRFTPSELTRGPWDREAQHAGPPAALLGREIERLPSEAARRVGRITFDILRPVPIAPLWVRAAVVRPGKRVELVGASLEDERGEVMRASAWRLRADDAGVPGELTGLGGDGSPGTSASTLRPGLELPGPGAADEVDFFPTGESVGYHTAMEYRFLAGEFNSPGPATVWMRMRHPLVAGEAPSPLARVLIAADSGNGVSATLDWRRWLFINVDLSVHLSRAPRGEWVCLDAITIPESDGIGLTDTTLYDERGPLGRALQTLLVGARGS